MVMQSSPAQPVRRDGILNQSWRRACLRLAAIGDSHFAGTNPQPSTMVCVPEQVVRDMNGGACLVANLAVGGSTSTQALGQMDVLPGLGSLDAVLVSTGTNDGSLASSTTRQTLRRNWLALMNGILAMGARPIMSTIPTDSTRSGSNLLGVKECNAWLIQVCQQMGVQVVNIDNLFSDAVSGRTATAYHDGGGLHSGYGGENLWASEICKRLRGESPAAGGLLAADRLDLAGSGMSGLNLCGNGLFTDGAGAGSTELWSSANGSLSTVVPLGSRTVGGLEEFVSGHWLKLAKTASGPSQMNGPSFSLGSYQAGDQFLVTCRVKARNFGTNASWNMMLLNWGAGYVGAHEIMKLSNDEINANGGRVVVWFGTPLAGATQWQPRFEIASNATWPYAPAPEIEVAQYTVRNVSELLRLAT
ncbi:SGNH/GDSL hydrolase family protein [Kamptonema cortianum]|nr:SGNH/GDSL hydrolase family protein [Geitlerinema splendidum]MDK3155904.1 SGNH/GDSL hydrolase family protein [Kamptonema cortianum]